MSRADLLSQNELKITEAQMPQWNAFADAFRASGQKMATAVRDDERAQRAMMSPILPGA